MRGKEEDRGHFIVMRFQSGHAHCHAGYSAGNFPSDLPFESLLQMRLIFGHFEQGGGYFSRSAITSFQKRAVLVKVAYAYCLVTDRGGGRRYRRRRRLAPFSESLLVRSY